MYLQAFPHCLQQRAAGVGFVARASGNDWGVRPNSFSLTLTHSPEREYWEYGFIIRYEMRLMYMRARHLLLICVELCVFFNELTPFAS